MIRSQSGFAPILVILFILLGIGLGVYVVGRSTHILPFASEVGDNIFDEPYYNFLDQPEDETQTEDTEDTEEEVTDESEDFLESDEEEKDEESEKDTEEEEEAEETVEVKETPKPNPSAIAIADASQAKPQINSISTPKPVAAAPTRKPALSANYQTIKLTPFEDSTLPTRVPFVRPSPSPKSQGGIIGFFSKIFSPFFSIF